MDPDITNNNNEMDPVLKTFNLKNAYFANPIFFAN